MGKELDGAQARQSEALKLQIQANLDINRILPSLIQVLGYRQAHAQFKLSRTLNPDNELITEDVIENCNQQIREILGI